nr:hypothetical protein CFP56_09614 [Quercus suber]
MMGTMYRYLAGTVYKDDDEYDEGLTSETKLGEARVEACFRHTCKWLDSAETCEFVSQRANAGGRQGFKAIGNL